MPKLTIEHEVEFEAYCAECDKGMCLNVTTRKPRYGNEEEIVIAPCKHCLNQALEEKVDELEAAYKTRIEQLEDALAQKAGE